MVQIHERHASIDNGAFTNKTASEKVLDAVEKYGVGHSPSWIQKKIPDVSVSSVFYHMTKEGFWPCFDTKGGGRGNPFTSAEDARIQKMRMAGASIYEIGRAIARNPSSVRMRLFYLASKE